MSNAEAWLAVMGLVVVTLATRGGFFLTRRELPMPGWLQKGLRYAPLAALSAVVVPEVLMLDGHLIHQVQDARLFAVAAAAAWFYWRRGLLGTMVAGMVVYLPLRLGLGW